MSKQHLLIEFSLKNNNIGSLEIHASIYISEKLKKYTYMSLEFPVEMNTRDSSTPTTFIPFKFKFIYLQGQCTLINITVNVPELDQKAISRL